MNYENLCTGAREAVREAAGYIRERHLNRNEEQIGEDLQIETKGRHNYVTEVDTTSEKILAKGLSALLPEAGFITEEGTRTKRGPEYNWVIDPVDGTTNFIHGLYPFAISVALARGEEVVAGIVYEFGLDECFYAWKGGGAWLNGEPVRVSTVEKVRDALIATGFPYTDYSHMDGFMESVDYFMKNSHGLRRLGSAATDIAYVACGRFDAFYEYGLNPWDIAAGLLLVREAGGKVSDFSGNPDPLFGEDFVCANDRCFGEFQSTVARILQDT